MNDALGVTLVGITVVVSALVILSLIVTVSSKIIIFLSGLKQKKESRAMDVQVMPDEPEELSESADLVETEEYSDEELVAVLTAAVAAYMGGSNAKRNIRVTSFRRIPQVSPAWNLRGRHERLSNSL